MSIQLSFLSYPEQEKRREYRRRSNGRFATKDQAELDRLKRERDYYKFMYEAEKRKDIANILRQKDEEINRLKKMIK